MISIIDHYIAINNVLRMGFKGSAARKEYIKILNNIYNGYRFIFMIPIYIIF